MTEPLFQQLLSREDSENNYILLTTRPLANEEKKAIWHIIETMKEKNDEEGYENEYDDIEEAVIKQFVDWKIYVAAIGDQEFYLDD